MHRRRLALALIALAAPLGGCVVVAPPRPRPAAVWVPGHEAGNGAWVPGQLALSAAIAPFRRAARDRSRDRAALSAPDRASASHAAALPGRMWFEFAAQAGIGTGGRAGMAGASDPLGHPSALVLSAGRPGHGRN